jgi:Predicted pyridoxal phosphate-dependent enzyme apparently involved in regulation of cell wall biogenesis
MVKLSSVVIDSDARQAVERVLSEGTLVHGEECSLFEKELASYLSCQSVHVVSSCTAALHLALLALGIGAGDAVIVPDFTFPATVNAVELVGAVPVVVDVEKNTYNINAELIVNAIKNWKGKETIRAIIPVHEFGCPADMDRILQIAKDYNLYVIEDAACALGTQYKGKMVGTFGDIGCFSFHPRKALTTGEGGAIVVKNKDIAHRIALLKNHGMEYMDGRVDFMLPGLNYRLTNFQAALGRSQLKKFNLWLEKRNELQNFYRELLHGVHVELPAYIEGHSWQTFMVILPESVDRDMVRKKLYDCGVETNLGAHAIHCLKYYKERYLFKESDFPTAFLLYKKGLALPFSQNISKEEIRLVVDSLKKLLNS